MTTSDPDDRDVQAARRWIAIAAVVAILCVVGILVATVVSSVIGFRDFTASLPSPSRELMTKSTSPDGRSVVSVYYVNPGAMGSASVAVDASPATGGKAREIMTLQPDQLSRATWAKDQETLTIRWRSARTLEIGGYPAAVPAW